MGSRFGGPGQKALQAMNEFTLFEFLPNPFIHDLQPIPLSMTYSQEFIKTDLYPLSLISLRYAVCLTGRWSIIGRCIGANGLIVLKKDDCNKKTSHLIL